MGVGKRGGEDVEGVTMIELQYPENWNCTRLKNVALINENSLSTSTHSDYILNYLEISNVNNCGIISKNEIRKLFFLDAPSRARRIVRNGDTVISSVRPNLQAIAYIKHTSGNLIASTGFYVVTPIQQRIDDKYTYYLLISDGSKQYLEAVAKGVGYPAVDDKDFGTLKFAIPSLLEQRQITSRLDKTCAAIDKAIEAKEKQLEILDALRKSIIHKAVTRGLDDLVELKDSGVEWLGRIPKHWNCEHLKRVCSRIQTGSTPPTANTEYYVDGTIPWYAPGCYDGGIYLQEPAKEINEIAYFNNKLRLYPAHSIFIVGIGATIGKVAMTRVEASCNQQITALVCNSDVYAKYLTYHLKIFESIIPRIAQFTTLPIIDQNKIGYLQIALPPIKEQEQIAELLDDKIAMNDRLENNLVKQISTLRQYRKSLIHECVTGKRRITDDDVQDQL